MANTTDPSVAVADQPAGRVSRWLIMVAVVIMLAGLLFGYDPSVISGTLEGIQQSFHTSSAMTEILTSWVTLGAMFGALLAGILADRIGRRATILLAAALFTFGAALESLAPNTTVLVLGRLTVGVGVGRCSALRIGAGAEPPAGPVRVGGARAAVILVMWPMPDTPRWLMKVNRRPDASQALGRIRPDADVEVELDEIADSLAGDDQASWGEVFSRGLRRPLMVGVGLAVFQQITGITAIIYYADQIFAAAGFSTPADQAAAATWAIGAVNILATLIAVFYVDRFGRRPPLLCGLVGMAVSLTTVGISFHYLGQVSTGLTDSTSGPSTAGVITRVGLVVFIASFAFSLGPVVWTAINEIFPSRVRGRAVALATAVNGSVPGW